MPLVDHCPKIELAGQCFQASGFLHAGGYLQTHLGVGASNISVFSSCYGSLGFHLVIGWSEWVFV